MKAIQLNLGENSYTIYIKKGIFKYIPQYLKGLRLKDKIPVLLTSRKIYNIYKKIIKDTFARFPLKTITVKDGERAKSKEEVFKIINRVFAADKKKRVFLMCFGGGVIGDLGGFVASIYKRGIPYIHVPTTFLAQIDSSIGGKTAINLRDAKNMVGTFYQPKAVFIDPLFLKTLKTKEIKEGLSESIKYGIIKDKALFSYLRNRYTDIKNLNLDVFAKIIYICTAIKADIVSRDEKEKKGIRTILNFGHTVGHALEASSRYKSITHGQAISLGMLAAARLSHYLGACKKKDVDEIKGILTLYGLPTRSSFDSQSVARSIFYDKKFLTKGIRMVILKYIGKVIVKENIPLKFVKKSLKEILRSGD